MRYILLSGLFMGVIAVILNSTQPTATLALVVFSLLFAVFYTLQQAIMPNFKHKIALASGLVCLAALRSIRQVDVVSVVILVVAIMLITALYKRTILNTSK